ncbi:hypothetical protein D3Z45_12660 [Lachnospiraceae bacterium]|nr:hypothetical protein [Lachnospiraceae bacterium]
MKTEMDRISSCICLTIVSCLYNGTNHYTIRLEKILLEENRSFREINFRGGHFHISIYIIPKTGYTY